MALKIIPINDSDSEIHSVALHGREERVRDGLTMTPGLMDGSTVGVLCFSLLTSSKENLSRSYEASYVPADAVTFQKPIDSSLHLNNSLLRSRTTSNCFCDVHRMIQSSLHMFPN